VKALRSVVFANGKVGRLTTAGVLTYEVEKAENEQYGNMATTVLCHSKVTNETAWKLKETVKPLLELGGRIIINLGYVNYLDSSRLGVRGGAAAHGSSTPSTSREAGSGSLRKSVRVIWKPSKPSAG
jgi:hypothetical protein